MVKTVVRYLTIPNKVLSKYQIYIFSSYHKLTNWSLSRKLTVISIALFHLENQLKVVKSSIDQTDENKGADSNQMHATENSNNIHLEHTNTPYDDDRIYDMGKDLCYCLDACI